MIEVEVEVEVEVERLPYHAIVMRHAQSVKIVRLTLNGNECLNGQTS